jgi:hypothetical protein
LERALEAPNRDRIRLEVDVGQFETANFRQHGSGMRRKSTARQVSATRFAANMRAVMSRGGRRIRANRILAWTRQRSNDRTLPRLQTKVA